MAVGDVLPVGATYGGAGWGVFDLPSGAKVLGVKPLRLRLDLTGTNGSGGAVRVQGDTAFSYRSGPPSCT